MILVRFTNNSCCNIMNYNKETEKRIVDGFEYDYVFDFYEFKKDEDIELIKDFNDYILTKDIYTQLKLSLYILYNNIEFTKHFRLDFEKAKQLLLFNLDEWDFHNVHYTYVYNKLQSMFNGYYKKSFEELVTIGIRKELIIKTGNNKFPFLLK